ncbi:MAG: hypothetical protein LC663_02390 [Actinobacteria bacterium]|nr:hypothetical protein [Actinomycetota bacterium]
MVIAAVGLEVFDATGRRLVLRGPGRSGGEGTVFAIEGLPLSLAKIYHPAKISAELRSKIDAMRSTPPEDVAWNAQRHRSIAWVEQALFHDAARARFAGFMMPAIDTSRFREAHLYFDPQDRIRRFGGGFTWRHLLGAATNIASAVAAVHAQGHRIGDLRETNVLVGPDSLIALIDCDSFQIRDPSSGHIFYSRVGTADYLPPELHGADFRRDHDRSHADLFALGVLVFKMLMEGAHPYQARGARVDGLPSTEAKIARGLFPYVHRRGVEPPPFAPPYEILPPSVRALFRRCFVDGHGRPSKRPSAPEWFGTLKDAGKRMRVCRANPNHAFGAHLRSCPWCRMPADPFPQRGTIGRQTIVTPPRPRPARARTPVPAAPMAVPPSPRRFKVEITKRRAVFVLSVAAFIALIVSPVGHAATPVRRIAVPAFARATGSCPIDPARAGAIPAGCRGAWRFGPVTRIERDSRTLFLLRSSMRLLEVRFTVRFGDGRCALPWIDSMSFNAHAPPVCLATCPQRIELRSGASAHPLVRASGVAARGNSLRCGETYAGAWTFDVAGARGTLTLRYPGMSEIVLKDSPAPSLLRR